MSSTQTTNQKKQIKNKSKDSFFNVLKDCMEGKNRVPISAQETIPYKQMFKDGICQVDEFYYNKTITYADINYQLAHNEDKQLIFGEYCSWLNYFDHSVQLQMTYINQLADITKEKENIEIPEQEDDFNEIRLEYKQMLQEQLEKGNNGLLRKKYITVTVKCDTLIEAKTKLARVVSDVINNFKMMGVRAYSLNGKERLELLHGIMNPIKDKFHFTWEMIQEHKCSTQDFIVPSKFDFRDDCYFKMGKKIGQSQYMIILAPELNDEILAKFLDIQSEMLINFHIQSIEQAKALKMIKSKISDIEAVKIEDQKKAVRSGYDMDIGSPELKALHEGAKRIYGDLQERNERWFIVTILITNFAPNKSKLDSDLFQVRNIAQTYNLSMKPYKYNQENCLISSLPLGINSVYTSRGLTTSSTAVFVPFTTQELFQGGNSLYYGLNALSNNMIMLDRKQLKNPNGLILGVPGSGKSFSSKREMTNVFLLTNDDVIICDPEGEYTPLVNELKGQVINLSATSKDYVNPLDINMDYSEDENPVTMKADFVYSMMELVCGGKDGLTPKERSIIDRCVGIIYQPYLEKPIPDNVPILEDLYNSLQKQDTYESKNLADALEIYVKGSLKVFNHHTNVDISNRVVCFNIKELGKNLKKLGMLIVQDQVWNRVTTNRNAKKSTWYYIDEFHLLLKDKETSSYSIEIWKRFRKWGGIPTGITQNVKDFLASAEIENIFENSNFIYLLSQAPGDKEFLAKKLNISSLQLSYVTDSNPGEGLLMYGGIILPFKDDFPKDTKLYQVMTTKLDETT